MEEENEGKICFPDCPSLLKQAEESNISLTFATIAKFLLISEGILDSHTRHFPLFPFYFSVNKRVLNGAKFLMIWMPLCVSTNNLFSWACSYIIHHPQLKDSRSVWKGQMGKVNEISLLQKQEMNQACITCIKRTNLSGLTDLCQRDEMLKKFVRTHFEVASQKCFKE